MTARARSLRPIRELHQGGEAARCAFGALVAHLGARYRYFPAFARLEGEALERALVARAEAICLELAEPPARIVALSAYGWGRFDRWVRARLMAAGARPPERAGDEHAEHRAAQEMVLALVEDRQLAAAGGVDAPARALPGPLEAALACAPRAEAREPEPWQLWVVVGADGVASWAVILALGERIEVLLAHDGAQLAAADEVLLRAGQAGIGEPLVVAPWCRHLLAPACLEGFVVSLAPFDLPDGLPPTTRAQAELRRVLGRCCLA